MSVTVIEAYLASIKQLKVIAEILQRKNNTEFGTN